MKNVFEKPQDRQRRNRFKSFLNLEGAALFAMHGVCLAAGVTLSLVVPISTLSIGLPLATAVLLIIRFLKVWGSTGWTRRSSTEYLMTCVMIGTLIAKAQDAPNGAAFWISLVLWGIMMIITPYIPNEKK